MKVLFVCSGNVGRSQMAEAFYNQFTGREDATSAGTDPTTVDRYPELAANVLQVMEEDGFSMEGHKVKLLDKEMFDKADKVYIMCDSKLCPTFLRGEKVRFMVFDDPFEAGLPETRRIRNEIKDKISKLVKELNLNK